MTNTTKELINLIDSNTLEILELINQARETLHQIKQHPTYQKLTYTPDITITDALASLDELQYEIEQ